MELYLSKNDEWHVKNIAQLQKELVRSDELFIKHYQNTYTFPDEPPIWVVCEVMSFGLLSKWLKSMRPGEPCNKIARAYQLDYDVLVSSLTYVTYVLTTAEYGIEKQQKPSRFHAPSHLS